MFVAQFEIWCPLYFPFAPARLAFGPGCKFFHKWKWSINRFPTNGCQFPHIFTAKKVNSFFFAQNTLGAWSFAIISTCELFYYQHTVLLSTILSMTNMIFLVRRSILINSLEAFLIFLFYSICLANLSLPFCSLPTVC